MSKQKRNRKHRYYIAYGSNLHLEQMACRCPSATVAGKSVMYGWTLRFRGRPWDHGVGTIERQKGGKVPILIWNLTPPDEAALDIYEGWPSWYRKEVVRVYLNGRQIRAMVYIMNEDRCVYRPPSAGYYNTIREGYETAGFDVSILSKAAEETRKLSENLDFTGLQSD